MQNTRSKSCYTCLSKDRNTWPLKQYSHIYIKLFDKSKLTMLNQRYICWECRAMFRKIEQFINKATNAQSILSSRARNNLKCMSTLKSVRRFKIIKINYEGTKLNKKNSQSGYEEFDVKKNSLMKNENGLQFGLPSQISTVDCNIDNRNTDNCDNNLVLDESLIKTEICCEKSENDDTNMYIDETKSADGYSNVDHEKYNKTDTLLEIKDEETSSNTNLNNVDDQDTKYESDDYNVENSFYDNEDEVILNKDPNNKKVYESEDETILKKETYHKNDEMYDSEDEMILKKEIYHKNYEMHDSEDEMILKKEIYHKNYELYDSEDEMISKKETYHKNDELYDSEDEIIISKDTNNKVSREERRKRRHNLNINSEVNISGNKNKTYICNDSPVKFENTYKIVPLTEQEEENWMKIERMDVTFNSNEFKCEKCILYWKSKKKLLFHNTQFHNRMTEYKCVYCDAYYQNKFTLRIHQDSRHCRLYVCLFCNTQYHARTSMYEHYDEKHNNTFQCKECPVYFGKIVLVREHYKQMHTRLQCHYCNKVWPTKPSIIRHIRANHLFICDICNKEFPSLNKLSYHKATKHEVREDETTFCVECNKQFTCTLHYKYHVKYSTFHRLRNGDPLYKIPTACPICNKMYATKNRMTMHLNFVHLKIYNYTCNICNKNFLDPFKLKGHNNNFHLGLKPPKNKICNVCGRGFAQNRVLVHHIRTHTGERPFECPHCSSRFAQKIARDLHVKNIHLKNAT